MSKFIKKILAEALTEDITLDIDKGDEILTGKFKNHKVVVKDIDTDEHGMPTVNGKGITKIRIPKNDKTIKESEFREANLEPMKEICKKLGLHVQGDFVSLFHGTSAANHKKILQSAMLKAGTWLSQDIEIARKYAMMASKGKSIVDLCIVYIGSLYYNGYFSTVEDLFWANGRYQPKGMRL